MSRRRRLALGLCGRALAFGQEGEDRLLLRHLRGTEITTYLDIGAFHPWRYSNTAALYLAGARGVCVDPSPTAEKLFRRWRRHDVFERVALGDPGSVEYSQFPDPAYNSTSLTVVQDRQRRGIAAHATTVVERVDPMEVIRRHELDDVRVGLCSIDAEGDDQRIVELIDWRRFRPTFVITESLPFAPVRSVLERTGVVHLEERGYELIAKMDHSLLFRRASGATA